MEKRDGGLEMLTTEPVQVLPTIIFLMDRAVYMLLDKAETVM
jgi:hypothetical protein